MPESGSDLSLRMPERQTYLYQLKERQMDDHVHVAPMFQPLSVQPFYLPWSSGR